MIWLSHNIVMAIEKFVFGYAVMRLFIYALVITLLIFIVWLFENKDKRKIAILVSIIFTSLPFSKDKVAITSLKNNTLFQFNSDGFWYERNLQLYVNKHNMNYDAIFVDNFGGYSYNGIPLIFLRLPVAPAIHTNYFSNFLTNGLYEKNPKRDFYYPKNLFINKEEWELIFNPEKSLKKYLSNRENNKNAFVIHKQKEHSKAEIAKILKDQKKAAHLIKDNLEYFGYKRKGTIKIKSSIHKDKYDKYIQFERNK